MIHWSWIIAGFVFGAWYGMLLVLLTTTRGKNRTEGEEESTSEDPIKNKGIQSSEHDTPIMPCYRKDTFIEDNVSQQELIVNPEVHVLDGAGDERKAKVKMFKRSVEDCNTVYLCLFGRRYIFHEGKYVGWYKP